MTWLSLFPISLTFNRHPLNWTLLLLLCTRVFAQRLCCLSLDIFRIFLNLAYIIFALTLHLELKFALNRNVGKKTVTKTPWLQIHNNSSHFVPLCKCSDTILSRGMNFLFKGLWGKYFSFYSLNLHIHSGPGAKWTSWPGFQPEGGNHASVGMVLSCH